MMICAFKLKTGSFFPLEGRDDPRAEFAVIPLEEYDFLTERDRECATLQAELDAVNDEAEHYKNLNDNLMRITKERGNQDRGVENKKEHDGYIVLSSCQYTEHYEREMTQEEFEAMDYSFKENHEFSDKSKPHKTDTAIGWRTKIQTPYSIDLQYENIGEEIVYELCRKDVLRSMGCVYKAHDLEKGTYEKIYDSDGYEACELYRILMDADYNSGYWIVNVYTTMPLIVTEERKPSAMKANSDNQKKNKKI